jgi:hypothetical protein
MAKLTWSEDSGYTFRSRAIDGCTSEKALPGPRVVPSERLALSVVPRLIGDRGACTVAALDAETGTPSGAEMTVAPVEDGRAWRLRGNRLHQRVEQTYRLTQDRRLSGMDEMLPLLWPRELRPVQPRVTEGAPA